MFATGASQLNMVPAFMPSNADRERRPSATRWCATISQEDGTVALGSPLPFTAPFSFNPVLRYWARYAPVPMIIAQSQTGPPYTASVLEPSKSAKPDIPGLTALREWGRAICKPVGGQAD
ncbi:hypothetical protein BO70DRAFT_13268 [Aspergillus heteromorphus CBS 117.55]|uniref:Uncharacterized protein n=1 Tax=Aspergillus heteromorphus CBS 117.55 TaxID=1448321 RepID=A0A317X2F5_9EURO|nr:uncharacterized protein BO70DRAFT_13268 [Aspergillus heteromorphus CBS 117.55]PWY92535.1 hypothetical protein BO70DRAFT_13268 [Aspergillus heteromorphus CBS 117.55]